MARPTLRNKILKTAITRERDGLKGPFLQVNAQLVRDVAPDQELRQDGIQEVTRRGSRGSALCARRSTCPS